MGLIRNTDSHSSHRPRRLSARRLAGTVLPGLALLLLSAAAPTPLRAQAPYVLPYIISTYAGGTVANGGTAVNTSFAIGKLCTPTGTTYSLDSGGDGCLAAQVLINTDPHDVRVDNKGNIYYGDNTGFVVHKFNPYTGLQTIYFGNLTSASACNGAKTGTTLTGDKYGDGCPANDGVANNSLVASGQYAGNTAYFSAPLKGVRGLGLAPNGDLFAASYNDDLDHKVTAATNLFTLVAGTLGTGATATAGHTNGPSNGSLVNTTRGIAADAAGNVYIADTGNNEIRLVNQFTTVSGGYTNGTVSDYTTFNSAKTLNTSVSNYASALVAAPEDVKVDSNGNIYIADYANNVVRAIFNAANKGGLPGITAPVPGNIYVVAGGGTAQYPTAGSAPVVATSIAFGAGSTGGVGSAIRKLGIDAHNNVYLADSADNVIWFLDAATGYMRVVAGSYGQASAFSATPTFVCAGKTNAIGDGCPGTQAALYNSSNGAADPDAFGNLYIADAQGGAGPTYARIRKLLSGLNFPATTSTAPVTQTILVHFAPSDSPLTPTSFVSSNTDFAVNGTPACTVQVDLTDDCLVSVTFTPSKTGLETANLKVTSTLNGSTNLVLTGTGSTAAVVFDPGNTALITSGLSNPQGVALDGAGNAYIADTGNNRVLFYSATTGNATVFAGGAPASCVTATDALGVGDGCLAATATLKAPKAVALGIDGNLYIADTGNNLVRKVNLGSGIISLVAGGATAVCSQATDTYGDGCAGSAATFSSPSGLAADNVGNVFVADTGNNLVREIGSNTWVSVLAGGGTICTTGTPDFAGDGCGAAQTTFNAPTGLAFDITGSSLFVADTGNSIVRKIYLGPTYTYTGTGTSMHAANILINPVTLVAGTGQASSSIDQNNVATNSGLSNPTGVAVDSAENVYIADTGNHAVRLVNSATNVITTIAGILGTSGTGTVPGAATVTQLDLPADLTVSPLGTLFIADSANNRVLSDTRTNITYNFGRINQYVASPVQTFTELNISTSAVTTPAFTQATPNTNFTLTAVANSNNSIPACPVTSLATGAICNLQGQFTANNLGNQSSTFSQTPSNAIGGAPSLTLAGAGAVLTPTTASVAQTTPATGNAQYGAALTLTTTVKPTSCNALDPYCYPTGSVVFVIDNVNSAPQQIPPPVTTSVPATVPSAATFSTSSLSVGQHTVSCNYSGDINYAPYTCPKITITIGQANTTSTLTFPAASNNQPQFTAVTLTATVKSTTIGTPNGSVVFYATSSVAGSAAVALNSSPAPLNNGVTTITLQAQVDNNGNLISNTTLLPGTYSLTCTYTGPTGSNYAGSNCPGVSFTVVPQPSTITLVGRGCLASALVPPGDTAPALSQLCPGTTSNPATPTVAVADGATTDATIFIIPTNTVSGTFTFKCSGLPADTACTFALPFIPVTASTAYATPVYTDVTFFTDVQPTTALQTPAGHGTAGLSLASMLGWPLTLLGLVGALRLRRRNGLRGLSLLAALLLMAGTALTFSGCAGPGDYVPVLTPAGTYPVTITVTNGTVSNSTVVNFTVTSPGIAGQE